MALIPERRAADAAVLNRTLFEQIVTFAWIAINPNEHPKQWVRWDRGQRIKSDNDLVDRGVEPLLDPDQREAFEAERDSGARMPDNLADRAAAADTHWSAVTEVIHADPTSTLSLRRMYRIIYRNESQFVHAAVNSLDPLIVPAASPGQFRVLPVETSPGEPNPFTNAPVIYGLGLVIGEHALDLAPMEPVLNGLFSSYYGAA